MSELVGYVTPKSDPSVRVEVTVEIHEGHVILFLPDREWLGSWRAIDLDGSYTGGSRFELTLKKEKIYFDADNPVRFLQELEAAAAAFQKPGILDHVKQELRLTAQDLFGPAKPRVGSAQLSSQVPERETRTIKERSNTSVDPVPAELEAYLQEVVDWLEQGMTAWFNFYFRLGSGSGQDRLEEAAGSLEKVATQLRSIGDQLDNTKFDVKWANLVRDYKEAVLAWALAMDQIAGACRLDQRSRATRGFARMGEASEMAERVLNRAPQIRPHATVTEALSTLDELMPAADVSKKVIEAAKRPWRRALLSAGWVGKRSTREP